MTHRRIARSISNKIYTGSDKSVTRMQWVVYQVVGYYVTRSVQVVGFFDVAPRLSAGDRPIASLVGESRCSIALTTPYI